MRSLIVVGSGVAGMTAALEACETYDVTLLTKAALTESNTRYAQGGVAVVTTTDDSVDSHVADTLIAGAGLSDRDATGVLCAEGPAAVDELIQRGVAFDRSADGILAHGLEAAHSYARILHAGGDATGAAISSALIARLRDSPVTIVESTMATDVIIESGRIAGVAVLDGDPLRADAVILATGGAGQLYPYTTNPDVATGDGVAIALRAGAVVADLEFYQFHPTSLDSPDNFLISETVRGEGATLLDAAGKRFMVDVHLDAELAPRDVVARGIAAQMHQQHGTPVRLDATGLGATFLASRFPNIDTACREHGFDWSSEPIPVTPAAHYAMGGVRTDEWGRTSIPGLYAVGEVACNGLHGANRLASNSLLEGAVYATRCVAGIVDPPLATVWDQQWASTSMLDLSDADGAEDFTRAALQALMWEAAGLSRCAQGLHAAQQTLSRLRMPVPTDAKSAEDANLVIVARAVVAMALARQESRGGHYRSDFPQASGDFARHSTLRTSAEERLSVRRGETFRAPRRDFALNRPRDFEC